MLNLQQNSTQLVTQGRQAHLGQVVLLEVAERQVLMVHLEVQEIVGLQVLQAQMVVQVRVVVLAHLVLAVHLVQVEVRDKTVEFNITFQPLQQIQTLVLVWYRTIMLRFRESHLYMLTTMIFSEITKQRGITHS